MDNPFPSLEMTERLRGQSARERLSTNENEFGPAPEVIRAIAVAAAEAHRYPDCDHFALRRALASALNTSPDTVHIGSGVDGLLGRVCHAHLGPGRSAVTTGGTYPTFAYFAESVGAAVRLVPYRDDHVDVAALARQAREVDAAVVYVADPDNPTGTSLGAHRLVALAAELPPDTLLVVDAAYTEYQQSAERLTAGDVTGRRMLWLRSFSKAYGLAGMRVGYAVGDPGLIGTLRRGAEHYVVGRVAESAALASLAAEHHLREVIRLTDHGRAHYTERLTELGFRVLPSSTNFVTFRCQDSATAEDLAESLHAAGLFVRHITAPDLADCVRVSIGPAGQREALLAAISEYLVADTAGRPTIPT